MALNNLWYSSQSLQVSDPPCHERSLKIRDRREARESSELLRILVCRPRTPWYKMKSIVHHLGNVPCIRESDVKKKKKMTESKKEKRSFTVTKHISNVAAVALSLLLPLWIMIRRCLRISPSTWMLRMFCERRIERDRDRTYHDPRETQSNVLPQSGTQWC